MVAPDPDFLDALVSALDEWEQGDVFALPIGSVVADPLRPLVGEPLEGFGSELVAKIVEVPSGEVAVITQTCDIVTDDIHGKPLVQVAPISVLPSDKASLATRGRMPRYVPAPWHGDRVFIDLAGAFSVEKVVLALSKRLNGPQSDNDRRMLGERLGFFFGRFAFPDEFQDATSDLRKWFQKGRPVEDSVFEIRAAAAGGDWNARRLTVHMYFCASSNQVLEEHTESEWQQALGGWMGLLRPLGRIEAFTGEYVSLDALPASEYVRSGRLDIEAQS